MIGEYGFWPHVAEAGTYVEVDRTACDPVRRSKRDFGPVLRTGLLILVLKKTGGSRRNPRWLRTQGIAAFRELEGQLLHFSTQRPDVLRRGSVELQSSGTDRKAGSHLEKEIGRLVA